MRVTTGNYGGEGLAQALRDAGFDVQKVPRPPDPSWAAQVLISAAAGVALQELVNAVKSWVQARHARYDRLTRPVKRMKASSLSALTS